MYKIFKAIVDFLGSLFGVTFFAPLFLLLIILLNVEASRMKRKSKKTTNVESSQNEHVLKVDDQSDEAVVTTTEVNADNTQEADDEPKLYFGGAILGQLRLGYKGKPFYLLKFRSMRSANEIFEIKDQTIGKDDPRVTPIGRFIRRFKIDELLQLVNVLKGQMSLVGPRPLVRKYDKKYKAWMREKFNVKPGMTGLAQIYGGTVLKDLEQRSYYDVYYARKMSLGLDLKILFKTIGVILGGDDKYKKEVAPEAIKAFVGESYEPMDEESSENHF